MFKKFISVLLALTLSLTMFALPTFAEGGASISQNNNNIVVTWAAEDGVSSYEVTLCKDGKYSTAQTVKVTDTTALSATFTISASGSYYAVITGGSTPITTIALSATYTQTATSNGISFKREGTTVTASWSAPTTVTGTLSYNVTYTIGSGTAVTKTVTDTSFIIADVPATSAVLVRVTYEDVQTDGTYKESLIGSAILSASGSNTSGTTTGSSSTTSPAGYSRVKFTIPVANRYGYATSNDVMTLTLPVEGTYVVVVNGVSYTLGLKEEVAENATYGDYEITFGTLVHSYNDVDKNACLPLGGINTYTAFTVIGTFKVAYDTNGNETYRVSASDFKYFTNPSQNNFANGKFATTNFWSVNGIEYSYACHAKWNDESTSYCWDWNPTDIGTTDSGSGDNTDSGSTSTPTTGVKTEINNLTLTPKNSYTTTVSWNKVSGASFYIVLYSAYGATAEETDVTINTSYDIPFGSGKDYQVYVYAVTSSGTRTEVGHAIHIASDTSSSGGSTTSDSGYTIVLSTSGSQDTGAAYSKVEFSVPVATKYGYVTDQIAMTFTLPVEGIYYVTVNGVNYALGLKEEVSSGETFGEYEVRFGALAHGYNTVDKNTCLPQSTSVNDYTTLKLVGIFPVSHDSNYKYETYRVSAADFKYFTDASQNNYTNGKFATTNFWGSNGIEYSYNVKAVGNDESTSYCWSWNPTDGEDILNTPITWSAAMTDFKWDQTLSNKAMILVAESAKVVVTYDKAFVGNYYFGLKATYTDGSKYNGNTTLAGNGATTYAAFTEVTKPTDTVEIEIPIEALYSQIYGVFNEVIDIEVIEAAHTSAIATVKELRKTHATGTYGSYSWDANNIYFCGEAINQYWNQLGSTSYGNTPTPTSVKLVLSTGGGVDDSDDNVSTEIDGKVLIEEKFTDFACSNWSTKTLSVSMKDLMAALAVDGSYVLIKRSEATNASAFPYGYEKFCITDGDYAMTVTKGDSYANFVQLGTAVHTIEMATANGEPYDIHIDALTDDGITVKYDGAEILELLKSSWDEDTCGSDVILISNTSAGNYDIVSFSVIAPKSETNDDINDTLPETQFPVIVSATSPASGKVSVKWTPVTGATSYKVYFAEAGLSTYNLKATVSGNVCTVTGLTDGTTYKVRVKALVNGTWTGLADCEYVSVLVGDTDSETISYTVSYNANGGDGVPSVQVVSANESVTLSTATPARVGYTFLGWSTNKSANVAQYLPGQTFTPTANTVLYAVWLESNPSHTGTVAVSQNKVAIGKTIEITVSYTGTSQALYVAPVLGDNFEFVSGKWMVIEDDIAPAVIAMGNVNDETGEGIIALDNPNEYSNYIIFKYVYKAVSEGTSNVGITLKTFEDNKTEDAITVPTALVSVTACEYIPGDFTDDGKVTLEDAIYLLYHTFNNAGYPLNQSGDFTDDGNVTLEDAIYLLYHTFNPKGYPLTK